MILEQKQEYLLPKLLFWQHLVLSILIAVLASRNIVLAAILFICQTLLILHTHNNQLKNPVSLTTKFILIFSTLICAYFYAHFHYPGLDLTAKTQWDNFNDPRKEQTIQAKILSVKGFSDGRLRLILDQAIIINQENNKILASIPKKLALTIDNYPLFSKKPIQGQEIIFKSKIRPTHGNFIKYYQDQGVWYTAYIYNPKNVTVKGKAYFFAELRQNIEDSFISLLFDTSEKLDRTKPLNQAKAILIALIFGDKFYLSQQTLDNFNNANLLHSLALSGQHLALSVLMATFLFYSFIFVIKPLNYNYFYPMRRSIFYISVPIAMAYLFLGNAPSSLLRAFIMLFLVGFFWLKAKNINLFTILLLAILIFIVFNPNSLFQLSVQLSFSAVFAIAFFLTYLQSIQRIFTKNYEKNCYSLANLQLSKQKWQVRKIMILIQVFFTKAFNIICSLFFLSFIIQLITLPIIITYFGKFSYFFLLNIVWLPILGFIILPFAFLALIFFPIGILSQFFLEISLIPTHYMILFLEYLTTLKFDPTIQSLKPPLYVFVGYYGLILFFIYKNKNEVKNKVWKNCLFLFCIGLICSGYIQNLFSGNFSLNLLDVGQGQAIVLNNYGEKTIIDSGGSFSIRFNVGRDIVAHFISDNSLPKIKNIFASHDDSDHINGLIHLIKYFNPENYYESYLPEAKISKIKTMLNQALEDIKLNTSKLGMGDQITLGNGFSLEILYPPYPTNKTELFYSNAKSKAKPLPQYDSNQTSLIMRLVKNNHGLAIFCGDADNEVLSTLLNIQKDKAWTYNKNKTKPNLDLSLQADILILPHHGSKNSYLPEFYQAVNPKYVLGSAGRYNRFGFPATEILDYFNKLGIPILRTDQMGNITFILNDTQWELDK